MKYKLQEYHKNISEGDLINDLQAVANHINKQYVSRTEYEKNGHYSASPYIRTFGTWINALKKAGLDIIRNVDDYKRIPDKNLLEDVKNVADFLSKDSITSREYIEHGRYSFQTILVRFKTWNHTLEQAGLEKTDYKEIADIDLYEEIERIWRIKGSQPTTTDIKNGFSKYSLNTYVRRFGGWRSALQSFLDYMEDDIAQNNSEAKEVICNCAEEEVNKSTKTVKVYKSHRTSRDINLRLRFKVLQRDHFKCCACGASPAKDSSVELHIDHIIPWSKGGETEIDNLQTLCSKCNFGKSDLL